MKIWDKNKSPLNHQVNFSVSSKKRSAVANGKFSTFKELVEKDSVSINKKNFKALKT